MNMVTLIIFMISAVVMGLPHMGMLDTPDVYDVGLFFDDINFKGNSTFLVEVKENPTCIPINVDSNGNPQGQHIFSVQVCKPTTCAFFTGEKCTADSTGVFSVSCEGPGDVPNYKSGQVFKSYICGKDISKAVNLDGSVALATVPHDPSSNAGMV